VINEGKKEGSSEDPEMVESFTESSSPEREGLDMSNPEIRRPAAPAPGRPPRVNVGIIVA